MLIMEGRPLRRRLADGASNDSFSKLSLPFVVFCCSWLLHGRREKKFQIRHLGDPNCSPHSNLRDVRFWPQSLRPSAKRKKLLVMVCLRL